MEPLDWIDELNAVSLAISDMAQAVGLPGGKSRTEAVESARAIVARLSRCADRVRAGRDAPGAPGLAPTMPYIAIDIETTSLDPSRGQVLELACVVETDWVTPIEQLPTFRRLVNPGEIRGEPKALAMNARLLEELAANPKTPGLNIQVIDLKDFIRKLMGDGPITIAGKNFGKLDYAFLARSPYWAQIDHDHRFIDIGNHWWDPRTDPHLPGLRRCQERAGLPVRAAHDAVEDCRAVVACVRAKYLPSVAEAPR